MGGLCFGSSVSACTWDCFIAFLDYSKRPLLTLWTLSIVLLFLLFAGYIHCSLPAMTLEEIHGQDAVVESTDRMHKAGEALHELLLSAQRQECLTVGVYESAKVMNVDPDRVTFCILAADEIDEGDIALQIHFTLIQAFCCENDINIVRLNDTDKLAEILGSTDESGEPKDLHCSLVTNPTEDAWKDPALEKLGLFCEESRNLNDWVPVIALPE
uniref:Growth arrest and DNA damage-inducible protein GADD45 gamma n=1 Tax=Leptobrachium leishanense TaxID=445787 RepID=A0A8C5LHX2_9ANUR